MNENPLPIAGDGQRGPSDHHIRDQIVVAAKEHFSHYGFAKTTVSDLARSIGFSKAYIYKFFDSKQAIGEAICAASLARIIAAADESVSGGKTATDKFRKLFRSLVETSAALFFSDRKLYDIAAVSQAEHWSSTTDYSEKVLALVKQIVLEGRESGEFERKTPLDETCRSIFLVMQPFITPLMLQHNLDLLPDAPSEITNLVLRSLSP